MDTGGRRVRRGQDGSSRTAAAPRGGPHVVEGANQDIPPWGYMYLLKAWGRCGGTVWYKSVVLHKSIVLTLRKVSTVGAQLTAAPTPSATHKGRQTGAASRADRPPRRLLCTLPAKVCIVEKRRYNDEKRSTGWVKKEKAKPPLHYSISHPHSLSAQPPTPPPFGSPLRTNPLPTPQIRLFGGLFFCIFHPFPAKYT